MVGAWVPVPPLLDAAGQVLCDLPNALIAASAAAKQQGQPGLDEGACSTVPFLAPGLCLGQDQFHQAEQLRAMDMEHQLLPPLLQPIRRLKVSPRTCSCHPQGWANLLRPACGVRWSRPCQIRGTWMQAQRKSREAEGSSLGGSKQA